MNTKEKEKGILERHFEEILVIVKGSIPHLDAATQYTLKTIIGEDEWTSFPKNIRNQLGTKFRLYVEENGLPLEFYGKNRNNANLYVKR
jgi:hypothetical protein